MAAIPLKIFVLHGIGLIGICGTSLRSDFILSGGISTARTNYQLEQSLRSFHVVQVVPGESNSF